MVITGLQSGERDSLDMPVAEQHVGLPHVPQVNAEFVCASPSEPRGLSADCGRVGTCDGDGIGQQKIGRAVFEPLQIAVFARILFRGNVPGR